MTGLQTEKSGFTLEVEGGGETGVDQLTFLMKFWKLVTV